MFFRDIGKVVLDCTVQVNYGTLNEIYYKLTPVRGSLFIIT